MSGTATWAQLSYLTAAVCFIVALKGLSAPRTARVGNLIGAAGAVLAVATVLISADIGHLPLIGAAILVGVLAGVPAARRVRMTAMPQLVAIFNGVGGAAAAIVALVEFLRTGETDPIPVLLATVFSVLVGCMSFTGSVLTFGKLQELMTGQPVVFPGARVISGGLAVVTVGLGAAVLPTRSVTVLVAVAVAALVSGVLFVLPVGGADVPVVISLLNAFTGLTVAASGYVLHSTLLIVAGTLVGAAGTLLTRLMAEAMGRSIFSILFGAFTTASAAGAGPAGPAGLARRVRSGGPEDVAILLGYARNVLIVPGYGLAVAQAQHTVKELADVLAERGVRVNYGVHPVAGRMPGHMNVLLAEANVPYSQLEEMEEANSEMSATDVALVVGANDVVNPSARIERSSPIYGMPILDVDTASKVVFLKRSTRPGFAGIDNPLLYDQKTTMLFGDAKESLTKLVGAVKEL
jgi:H+-translocating NAD(P) transhydrogenase subunit beta